MQTTNSVKHTIYTRTLDGMSTASVSVEADITGGLPAFAIVGLPEKSVKESRERVRSALLNSQFRFPNHRIIVNLAPAITSKTGNQFDLPIALGILAASKQLPQNCFDGYEFFGELALNGELRQITNTLPFAIYCQQAQRQLVLPSYNAEEASLVSGLSILPAKHLLEVCSHLLNVEPLIAFAQPPAKRQTHYAQDLQQVVDQPQACRALEVCAAGGHNLLLFGAPGTGKTLLASCLPSILPSMQEQEALAAAQILSLSQGHFSIKDWGKRPFRSPHHNASYAALVGGGSPPKLGEVSRSHCGVLFLDELAEFKRSTLDSLREPLESGTITISRAAGQTTFPADFQLIAAMNPCVCGFYGESGAECICSQEQVRAYQSRVSGPLLDRIDIRLRLHTVTTIPLFATQRGEDSACVRSRVEACRQRQLQTRKMTNAHLSGDALKQAVALNSKQIALLQQQGEKLQLSARALTRVMRVSRTLADMDQQDQVSDAHLYEALTYQMKLFQN